jgi:hypothetical protein
MFSTNEDRKGMLGAANRDSLLKNNFDFIDFHELKSNKFGRRSKALSRYEFSQQSREYFERVIQLWLFLCHFNQL